jgi:hypothetical protein
MDEARQAEFVRRLREWARPLPPQRARLPFERRYTAAEWRALSRGLVPSGWDDRWFIHLEGRSLFFHRSWTGICVYEVLFQRARGGWEVREALVNQAPDQYGETDLEQEAAWLNWVIEELLLRRYTPTPRAKEAGQGG